MGGGGGGKVQGPQSLHIDDRIKNGFQEVKGAHCFYSKDILYYQQLCPLAPINPCSPCKAPGEKTRNTIL